MKKRARDATATSKAAKNGGLRRRGLLYSLDIGRLMGVPVIQKRTSRERRHPKKYSPIRS
jgi:hypothetical protein